MPGTRKLGRTTAQRMAMLRQQVTDLLDKGKMETTVTRAKEIAPMAEKMITLGKAKDLASYRQALSFITREDVAKKVFDELSEKYADRSGGYTREKTASDEAFRNLGDLMDKMSRLDRLDLRKTVEIRGKSLSLAEVSGLIHKILDQGEESLRQRYERFL